MTKLQISALLFCSLAALSACTKQDDSRSESQTPATAASADQQRENSPYQEIEWPDLMPKDDLDALMNPPEYLGEIADGSEADSLDNKLSLDNELSLDDTLKMQKDQPADAYQKALVSTRIIPEFNKRKIRLPGFIVPLDFDDHQIITQFLLVPFFGACIHLPPPPPNQIIFATYEPGLPLDDLSDAFFVEGTIFTELKEHDLATSAYSMTIDRILPYEEPAEGE